MRVFRSRPRLTLSLLALFCAGGLAHALAPGDVNNDGKVNIIDAIFILRATTTNAALTPDQKQAADVAPASNGGGTAGDGAVNVNDAILMLRYIAGLVPGLGNNPVPPGVTPARATVLRGKVLTRDGAPLAGVTVAVKGVPQLGSVKSGADGTYRITANGGGLLTLDFSKEGYLPAQRQRETVWKGDSVFPDVALVALDPKVTPVDLSGAAPMQVAQGSPVSDKDGARQATLLFPSGTTASLVLPDGTVRPAASLNVRATEYTVGPNGPKAMPADLPPTTAYTYAVELSADEAIQAGAKEVRFNKPVYSYTQNFLEFPVGESVPAGYYDRDRAAWIPSNNGKIIKVLGAEGGKATLDTDGDAQPDSPEALAALSVTDEERTKLASLYTAGQTLWRVPIPHFTPWDYNWGYGCPDDDEDGKPDCPPPHMPQFNNWDNDPCKKKGSIIDVQNQSLGEQLNIHGTPFTLNYFSDRMAGRKDNAKLTIPVTGPTVPARLKGVQLEVSIGGKSYSQSFGPQPNQTFTLDWDGQTGTGASPSGTEPVHVKLGYTYPVVYLGAALTAQSFGQMGGLPLTGNRGRFELSVWQEKIGMVSLGKPDLRKNGLGGWTVSVHHTYDPVSHTLYLGDGGKQSDPPLDNQVISTFAGAEGKSGRLGDGGPAQQALISAPNDILVAPDGTVYFSEAGHEIVRKISPAGIISTVAGTPPPIPNQAEGGYGGDGGPAIQAKLNEPAGIALGPDGSLYIADRRNHRVRKVSPDGIITTVAGIGQSPESNRDPIGDGGPATEAKLNLPSWVTVAPDGSLYISDHFNRRVRRVDPNGIITTVAGGGDPPDRVGDGGPATDAELNNPAGVKIGPDGAIYVAEFGGHRVRRIGTDGIITTFAGTGVQCGRDNFDCGDGGEANAARLHSPHGLAFGADGSLYIAESGKDRIRRVTPDGIIRTVAGNAVSCGQSGSAENCGDNGPATEANLRFPQGIAISPDGSLFIAEGANYDQPIRKVSQSNGNHPQGAYNFPSGDGSQVYVFDGDGRHQRTVDALTGVTIFLFGYDTAGRLTSVTDRNGSATTLERDGSGNVTAIVSPYGERTALAVGGDGFLSEMKNPAGQSIKFGYGNGGLMTTLTDPKGGLYRFTYDSEGRLVKDEDPSGGFKALVRKEEGAKVSVTVTTAGGQTSGYTKEMLTKDTSCTEVIRADGLTTRTETDEKGIRTTTYPDGSTTTLEQAGDPRFGMKVPVAKSLTVTTPGKLKLTTTTDVAVEMESPTDLFSLRKRTEIVTRNGRRFTTVYDATTRTLTTTSAEGRKSTITLDDRGRPVSMQAGNLAPMLVAYDDRGFPISVTHQGAGETRGLTYGYNDKKDLVKVTDVLNQSVSYTRDLLGRAETHTLPDNGVIGYAYDERSNPTAITPPGRPPHLQDFTPTDLPAAFDPASSGEILRYAYDKDGRLQRVVRPDGKTVEYAYDAAGRPASIAFSTGGAIQFGYNAQTGQLASVTAPSGIGTAFTYDGSLVKEEKITGPVTATLSRTYDNNFWLTGSSINGRDSVSYQYDGDGLLRVAGNLTIQHIRETGMIQGTALGKVTTAHGYNAFGELATFEATGNGASLYKVEYARDPVGRFIKKVETTGGATSTTEYAYDAGNRLVGVKKDGVTAAAYAYDLNGNRLSETANGKTVNATYDAQDRLTTYGPTAYTWSPGGEMLTQATAGQTTAYAYDSFGNLTGAALPDGRKVEYLLDASYRRMLKRIDGVPVQGFLYEDALRPSAELDGQGKVVSRFVYGGQAGAPAYIQKGGVAYRVIVDHLGSPRLVVNAGTGEVMQRMDYDAFGNVTQDTNPGFQPFGFAGGLYDRDTGLVHFGAREYDPKAGRWTRRDPILFQGRQANLYAYVDNNPVMKRDPSGLLTSAQCHRLRQVKEFERENGTWETARKYSNTPGYYDQNTPLGDSFNNQPIETAIGTIDLDWYTDIAAFGGTAVPHSPLPTVIYYPGKHIWNTVRLFTNDEIGASPFEDKKEVVALNALEWGYTYNDLFPEEFLRHVCPCDDQPPGQEPPTPAPKLREWKNL